MSRFPFAAATVMQDNTHVPPWPATQRFYIRRFILSWGFIDGCWGGHVSDALQMGLNEISCGSLQRGTRSEAAEKKQTNLPLPDLSGRHLRRQTMTPQCQLGLFSNQIFFFPRLGRSKAGQAGPGRGGGPG